MNLEVLDIIIFIVGVAVGFSVSVYIKKQPIQQNIPTPEGVSEAVFQQNMEKKQLEIDNFFKESNIKLEQTEQLIADLRSQLSNSANQLSTTKIPSVKRNAVLPEEIKEANTIIAPPLDYAPKEGLDEPGTLSEEFGLSNDKNKEKVDISNNETIT